MPIPLSAEATNFTLASSDTTMELALINQLGLPRMLRYALVPEAENPTNDVFLSFELRNLQH